MKPYLCQQATSLPSPCAALYMQPGIWPPGSFGLQPTDGNIPEVYC